MPVKRALQKEQTREKIIAAAIKVYSEHGFTAPTSVIAGEAQISHGSIFVHFPTVESLLICLLDSFSRDLNDELHALSGSGDDIEKKTHILIINNPDVMDTISSNKELLASYKNIVTKYRTVGLSILFGNYENNTVAYSAPEILKTLKESRHFLFFDDLSNMKIIDIPVAKVREYKKPISVGDAYYIKNNEIFKIKTVKM